MVEEREDCVAQNVLEPWTPAVAEHTFQYPDDFRGDIVLLVRVIDFHRVETERKCGISRIEVDDVVDTISWDEMHVVDRKVTVRVDDSVSVLVVHVAECE